MKQNKCSIDQTLYPSLQSKCSNQGNISIVKQGRRISHTDCSRMPWPGSAHLYHFKRGFSPPHLMGPNFHDAQAVPPIHYRLQRRLGRNPYQDRSTSHRSFEERWRGQRRGLPRPLYSMVSRLAEDIASMASYRIANRRRMRQLRRFCVDLLCHHVRCL